MEQLDKAYTLSTSQVLRAAETAEGGLSTEEAERRLNKFGSNVILEEKKFKTLRLLASQFKNFFIVLLIFASILSFAFESATNGFVLLVVVALNVAVSFLQERKAEKTIESLRKIYPNKVEVIRSGESMRVDIHEIVVGDVVVLREGVAVPADLRLLEESDLKVDEAALTGESVVSEKVTKGLGEGVALGDRKNMAFAGTLVVAGEGLGVVVATGGATELGRIAAFVQEEEERSLLLERIAHLGVWLVGISAMLSLLILALGFIRSHELIHTVNFAIAVFVSAVPESLPTITTLALALSALRLSKRRVLVRHLATAETLSGIDLFAFDKTGTLTLNEMSVAKIVLPSREFEVTGTGFSSAGEILEGGRAVDPKSDKELSRFVKVGTLSASAAILPAGDGGEHFVVRGDPTEGAFHVLARKAGVGTDRAKFIKDFTFTSARRMRSRVFKEGENYHVYALGAPEEILALCPQHEEGLQQQADELARAGYRVLALATKTYRGGGLKREEVERDLTFVGFGALLDKPKEHVADTFRTLRGAGIRPIVITGDHPGTALAVARSLGLEVSDKSVLSGRDLDGLSDEELIRVAPHIWVFARISPTQKYRLVSIFKDKMGLRVAVSGDGVNDAPALKKSDVGVVMGRKGTDVSKDAADLVIMDDEIEAVLPAISEARTLYDNIKKFFTFLLSGNFEELLIIAAALVLGLPQPFTTIQILWVNFVTDAFPAFALAYDPPSEETLKTKPRDLSSKMIRPVLLYALFLGAISLIGESFLFVSYLPDVDLARTMIFTGAVLFELFIVFSIRTSGPIWEGLFTNRYLIWAFLLSFSLQLLAIYLPPLQSAMGTVALDAEHFGIVGAFVLASLVITETGKWVVRLRSGG
ncbi:HAD-IC family P-type ATPase [Candidatus Saccharibacteria bacterium]|nr:HAD-IC family P-type ATPase [Candidatus Saccharibacteria bacterium]